MTLQIDVKDKDNINQGLEEFITGEVLEGENAYYCDRCDKKVRTVKRGCVKRLPNMLIVVLKRFEFNLMTFMRDKLNNDCAFPEHLNMKSYC